MGEGNDVMRWPESLLPHPRWNAENPGERHPKELSEWDWREDGVNYSGDPHQGGLARSRRRLAVAQDFDDPRAPDQMAVVLRIDLIRTEMALVHRIAQSEARQNTLSDASAEIAALQAKLEAAERKIALIAKFRDDLANVVKWLGEGHEDTEVKVSCIIHDLTNKLGDRANNQGQ